MDDERHHTRSSPAFQGFVPVQFDTAWAGQRGAQEHTSCNCNVLLSLPAHR